MNGVTIAIAFGSLFAATIALIYSFLHYRKSKETYIETLKFIYGETWRNHYERW